MIASRSVQAGSQYPCYLAWTSPRSEKKQERKKNRGALRKKQISYVGVATDTVPRNPDPKCGSRIYFFAFFVILICASRIVCVRAMQEREDKMLSIRSMIERFRETKPTSRQEREQARKQKKVGVRFVRGGREA